MKGYDRRHIEWIADGSGGSRKTHRVRGREMIIYLSTSHSTRLSAPTIAIVVYSRERERSNFHPDDLRSDGHIIFVIR